MLPQGEKVRKAVRWISDYRLEDPALNMQHLINAAITRFDLNPKESEELMQFYRNVDKKSE